MERDKQVDKYIENIPEEFRPIICHIRDKIFEYMPEGTETFAYQIPVYRYLGRPIFSIAAFKNHYSIITQDKNISDKIPELKKFKVSGTTVHFTGKTPVTDEILKKIVETRISDREKSI